MLYTDAVHHAAMRSDNEALFRELVHTSPMINMNTGYSPCA